MNRVIEQSGKASETNNEKLERFQKNITESLIGRFDVLNKQIDAKLIEINKESTKDCLKVLKIQVRQYLCRERLRH